MDERKEILLELPWDIVDKCSGFSLDFGGSVCKAIYLHKNDWIEKGQRKTDTVSLRCVSIPRHEFDDGLKYLKERVHLLREDNTGKPSIFTTGIGGSQYATKIRETFDIQTQNINEFECFVAAFTYMLKNMKIKDVTHGVEKAIVDREVTKAKTMLGIFGSFFVDSPNLRPIKSPKDPTFAQEKPLDKEKNFADYDDMFPCFVSLIGSGGGVLVIHEDGTYEFAADLRRAGKPFMGLASLLTGAKSYDELMGKAERGDMHNIHEYFSDLSKGVSNEGEDKDNMYGAVDEMSKDNDEPCFWFGKCLFQDPEKFQKEDVARSLLRYCISDMVQVAHTPLNHFENVRHCFFAGGFPTHELVRDMIFTEWMERETNWLGMFGNKITHHVHFLKHAAFFGALGAYLNPKLQFRKLDQTVEN